MDYTIKKIITDKKQYLDLLLLADEQESMIDRYLERGEMFLLEDNGPKAICVVTDEGNGVCELKNIAVTPDAQRQGYGRKFLNYLITYYVGRYNQMIVGTGDVPSATGFYKSCGFEYSHRIENFFIDNYDHLIIEEGILLKDMVYLKQDLKKISDKLQITYIPVLPDKKSFYDLYNTTDWNKNGRTAEQLYEALKNSWFFISAYSEEKLIGCGRIISDGCLHALITEMIIYPDFQNQGIGKDILNQLVTKALTHGIIDIQLFCAKGKEDFYLKNSFIKRPDDAPGMQFKL